MERNHQGVVGSWRSIFIGTILGLLAIVACSASTDPRTSTCTSDFDCKGGRVCEEGRCIDAGSANATATSSGTGCTPSCAERECGDDGCGNSCGSCGASEVCKTGTCVSNSTCTDTCSSKGCSCGTVCGNACGSCGSGKTCGDGCHCTCVPNCSGKKCGDDGCGGSCGSCKFFEECSSGSCKQSAGTWFDPATGRMWENPPSAAPKSHAQADSYCASLVLGGYLDWRLPDLDELRTLVRGCPQTMAGGTCLCQSGKFNYTCIFGNTMPQCSCYGANGEGNVKGPENGCYWAPGLLGNCGPDYLYDGWYWASDSYADNTTYAAEIRFSSATIAAGGKSNPKYVRCVRF